MNELLPPDFDDESEILDPDRVAQFVVEDKIEPIRIDQFLTSHFPDISRSLIKKAIDADKVVVNGKITKASYKVRHNDNILLEFPTPPEFVPVPEDIPLDILFEDEYLAVINKPPDMVVHPAKGNWRGTLVNALRFHFTKLSNINGDYRPGIVHRLDRDTSGVILVAKDEKVHRALGLQFENRKIYKEYLAIVAGVLDRDSDYIERRITKHRFDRVKMAVTDRADEGKEACSFYEVIERLRGYTFCRISPRTGRTHQIRVHLSSVNCPVLADKVYSGRDCLRLSDLSNEIGVEEDVIVMPRQALHAHRLRFTHPIRKEVMESVAPLPDDFDFTLRMLREYRLVDGD